MTNKTQTATLKIADIKKMRRQLFGFYDAHGRTLPWRIRPEDRVRGMVADPYEIWLSEIMCQQTSVVSAAPYWKKFLQKWPRAEDLARAERDDVLAAWAGLGYYARARNLHKCANVVLEKHSGKFPQSEAQLLTLPGIGAYTAAAMAAICWGEATNVVDGNVERVISRIFAVTTPMPAAKKEIRALAKPLADPKRSGDYAQGLMDLGAHVCTPKNPKCGECPWSKYCVAYAQNDQETYPIKVKKGARPVRFGAVFYLEHEGQIFLRQRPEDGLLGGMIELPTTQWQTIKLAKKIERDLKAHRNVSRETLKNQILPISWPEGSEENWIAAAPTARNWQKNPRVVEHVFTHFTLYLQIYCAEGAHGLATSDHGFWHDVSVLDDLALSSLMRKAIEYGS